MAWTELADMIPGGLNDSAAEMWSNTDPTSNFTNLTTSPSVTSLPDLYLTLASNASFVSDTPNSTTHHDDTMAWCFLDPRTANFSHFEYIYRKSDWIEITWLEVLKILAYIITFLVSVVGNILVILVVKCNSNMRSTTNQYLVNLAVADLFVTLVCTWAHMIRHLSYPNYILPAIMCKLEGFVQATALAASVFTLTAISIGRFVAIIFPFHARTSPNRTSKVIAVVWIASALLSSPLMIYREMYSTQWSDFTSYNCEDFFPIVREILDNECTVTYDPKKVYYVILTTTSYFLPVSIMLLNFSLIVWKLWGTQQPGEQHQQQAASTRNKRRVVVRMVSVVLLVFVICWTPFQVIVLYGSIYPHHSYDATWIEFTAYFMAQSNSALNPIIYCGFNANFRRGLLALLSSKHSRGGRSFFPPQGSLGRMPSTVSGYSGPEPAVLIKMDSLRNSRLTQSTAASFSSRLKNSGSRREFCYNNHNNFSDSLKSNTRRSVTKDSGELQVALAQRTFVRASYSGRNGRMNNHTASISCTAGGRRRDQEEDACGCCCIGGERDVGWREGGRQGWGKRGGGIGEWGRKGRWGTVEKREEVVVIGREGTKDKDGCKQMDELD